MAANSAFLQPRPSSLSIHRCRRTSPRRLDIDSGRTRDKVGVLDPDLSSLGTDDEAAGRPPSPFLSR